MRVGKAPWRAAMVAMACTLVACGGDDPRPAAQAKQDTPRAAMKRWAAAATPRVACDQMTFGFELFLSDGDPRQCVARMRRHLQLDPGPVRIVSVRHHHGQELVKAAVGDEKATTYYFLFQHGRFRLNSIGIDLGPNTPAGPKDTP